MSKRDWAIAAVGYREKNESLRAELAEKRGEIHRLRQALRCCRDAASNLCVYETARDALERDVADADEKDSATFTADQIDKAWGWRGEFIARNCPSLFDTVMRELGIVACPKCRGTKHSHAFDHARTCDCPNNGWVIEERKNHE